MLKKRYVELHYVALTILVAGPQDKRKEDIWIIRHG
jgi:hypothetical protein